MKKLFITALVLVSCIRLSGQSTNASPYSRFALGDVNTLSLAQNTALGGSTVSLVDSFQVNILNPASYCFTAKHSPVFDFSAVGRFLTLSTTSASTKSNYINPNNLALVMPFTSRWGAAFGMVTYSNTGYRIISEREDTNLGGTVINSYTGAGSINRVFLGSSYMVIDKKHQYTRDQLSLGANASYMFGDIEKKRQIFLPTTSGTLDAEVTNSLYARDFMFDGGFIYRHNINVPKRDSTGKITGRKSQQLTVGMSASLGRDTKFHRSVFSQTISQTTLTYVDTAQYIDAEKGTIYIPSRYNFGLTYDFKGVEGSNRYYKLTFTAQYNMQDWTKYKENFASGSSSDSLRRSNGINFGIQYIPHQLGFASGKIKLLKVINYRVGFYSSNQALNVSNTGVKTWAVTGGFGIPLIHSASYSMLNLSFEYGARGSQANGLVLEKYYGFHLGVAFSPSRVDRWFVKRKYD